jgi:DNA-binding beta-propeller fold protein YncE
MRRIERTCYCVALLLIGTLSQGSRIEAVVDGVPTFQADPDWPKLPNKLIYGRVGGIFVDAQDHVWVLQRPKTIDKADLGALENPPRSECCTPAPPVLEFDANGNFIQGWGGPAEGYDWPGTEHGIYVDHRMNVWIAGSGSQPRRDSSEVANPDSQILKFTKSGKFVLQVGRPKRGDGSNDTEYLGRPTDIRVDSRTNEVFVSDGYTNRRVIVFDADTGQYKRHWGAYGNKPDDSAPLTRVIEGPAPQQFNTPHALALSNDRLLYVGDRLNSRIQVFRPNGTFVKEGFVARNPGGNTVGGLAFSPDKEQTFLYVADAENDVIWILNRDTLETVGRLGRHGYQAGQWVQLHMLATDSKGNLYTAEVNGKRVQKLVFKGLSRATSVSGR